MAQTDQDAVYSVMSDSGADPNNGGNPAVMSNAERLKRNPFLRMIFGASKPNSDVGDTDPNLAAVRGAYAFPSNNGRSPFAGSSADPSAHPSTDPASVVARNNSPSTPGKEAKSLGAPADNKIAFPHDPNDPNFSTTVSASMPYVSTELSGAGADGAANSSAGGSATQRAKETHGQTAGHGNALGPGFSGDYNPDMSAILGADNAPYAASNIRFARSGQAVVPGQQNPIVGFFAKLGRAMGIASPQLAPENGAAPSPATFDQVQRSRFGRVMDMASGLGNAMAQFGSPREAELSEQRSQFQQRLPLERMQLERQLEMERNEIAYRNAMIGLRQAGLDEKTSADKARIQVALEAAQRRGLVTRADKDGNFYAIDQRTGRAVPITADNAADFVASISGFPNSNAGAGTPSYARSINGAAPNVSGSPTAKFLQAPIKPGAAARTPKTFVMGNQTYTFDPNGNPKAIGPAPAHAGRSSKSGKIDIVWGKDGQAIGIRGSDGQFWTGDEPNMPDVLAGPLHAAKLHPKQPPASAKQKGKIVF